jgi:hypothetical protein
MIFRAMIGVGLVLLLAESSLGKAAGLSLPAPLNSSPVTGPSHPTGQRGLADVKAEIDSSLKARGRPFYQL